MRRRQIRGANESHSGARGGLAVATACGGVRGGGVSAWRNAFINTQ